MKRILLDVLPDVLVGAGIVPIMVLLLGELVGYPIELTPGEWAIALLAGASLPLPGYVIGYRQWKREMERRRK